MFIEPPRISKFRSSNILCDVLACYSQRRSPSLVMAMLFSPPLPRPSLGNFLLFRFITPVAPPLEAKFCIAILVLERKAILGATYYCRCSYLRERWLFSSCVYDDASLLSRRFDG